MATELRVRADDVREGDLVTLQGARKRVVEGNVRSTLNRTLRELRVRGIGTHHFRCDELVTVWRDWGLPSD